MSKRIFIRIAAAILMLCMILPVSGCNSLFLKVATNIADTPEEQTNSNYAWPDHVTRRIEIKNTYKDGGTDAFYIDGEKCLKDEIEEFHFIHLGYNYTVYYYTATANPSYKSGNGTGYYCLAVYSFYDRNYKVLTDGFYDQVKGNASFAFTKAADNDYAFACLGDTFMDIYVGGDISADIVDIFTLSYEDKDSIRADVGGDYVCTDIAYIDDNDNRVVAVFMYAGTEDNDNIRFVEYDINFDDSEKDPVHSVKYINSGIIGTDSIVSSAGAYPIDGTVFTYNYSENSKKLSLYRYSPFAGKKKTATASINAKNEREEELISLAIREFDGEIFLFFLFDDHMKAYWAYRPLITSSKYQFASVGDFELDQSDSYATFDVIPSIITQSPDKILGCSLNNGFFAQSSGKSPSQIKSGAYYAAYQIHDEPRYYLIGFEDTTHKRTTTHYEGDMVVSSTTETVPYSMNDLPFAKIYSASVPADLQ